MTEKNESLPSAPEGMSEAEKTECLKDQARSKIEENGYTILYVDASPPFAYTAGLFSTYQHPELLVQSAPLQVMNIILTTLADTVVSGKVFKAGCYDLDAFDPVFFPVSFRTYSNRKVNLARALGGSNIPVLRVVLPGEVIIESED